MHVYTINNCSEYYSDDYTDMKANNFLCKTCADGYYFSDATRNCVERTKKPT